MSRLLSLFLVVDWSSPCMPFCTALCQNISYFCICAFLWVLTLSLSLFCMVMLFNLPSVSCHYSQKYWIGEIPALPTKSATFAWNDENSANEQLFL